MSVNASLDALLADALTSDYHRDASDQSDRLIIRIMAGVSAVALAFLLGFGVHSTATQAEQNGLTRQALVSRIKAADGRVTTLEKRSANAQRDLQAAEAAHLTGTSLGLQAQLRLDRLRTIAGFTAVTGAGIEIVLTDAPIDPTAPDMSQTPGRVIDRDLQEVVNGLWQSGATAITINDRRLTATSAIRAAGSAILVNYRPLIAPYRIRAIAPRADALAGRFRESSAGLQLEQLHTSYGINWDLQTIGSVTLPGATTENSGSGG
ncbi:MAG: DUF881 domain-containing protein [Actinomycetes bacterium]